MINRIIRAAENGGWILALLAVIAVASVAVIYSQIRDEPPPLIDAGDKVNLPVAPREILPSNPCPKGWKYSPGVLPPDAVNINHVGARSFYTCQAPISMTEVTVWDNGDITGYTSSGVPLSRAEAVKALEGK